MSPHENCFELVDWYRGLLPSSFLAPISRLEVNHSRPRNVKPIRGTCAITRRSFKYDAVGSVYGVRPGIGSLPVCHRAQRHTQEPNHDPGRMACSHFGRSAPPNGLRLSCGALKKDSFHNLRAPSASSAC